MSNNNELTGKTENIEKQLLWSSLGIHCFVKLFILALLFIGLYWTDISNIVSRWLSDSSWSHGFLIPFFSLYFINQKKDEILITEKRTNYLGLFALISLIILYILNTVQIKIAYGQPLIMIASIGAIVLFLGGWKLVKYLWLPIAYLFFAVPLPARLYREITIPMRQLAAKIASTLLSWVPELQATASGVVIDVVYKGKILEPALDVAEACSGMRLLMAFLALGVAMAYLHDRPVWQRIILLLSTVPIAILCNIIRVTTTGFIYILIAPKYAQGIYHDALGMLMLPLAFILYGLLAKFMNLLFIEEDIETSKKEEIIIRRKK